MATRILVIDDTPENQELVSYLLSAAGYSILSANNAADGIRVAIAELPDLIICDNRMPGGSGFDVVAALKTDPRTSQIPLISATSSAMVGDRERLLDAGFDGYIAKPIEPTTFVVLVESYLAPELRL